MAAVRSTVRYVSVRPKQEALRRRLRELAAHWFLSLDDARDKIESWREDYNGVRPHSSLKNLTPNEFASGHGPTVPAAPPPPAHAEVSYESTRSSCT